MAMAFEHLKVAHLTKDELEAALECEKQLSTLKFISSPAGYDVCDDPEKLLGASDTFVKQFAPWLKFGGGKASKIQAFRFDKSATLPVSGSMLFIPTIATGNPNPTISGKALEVGSYVQLTEDVFVQSRVYCLAFRAN